MSHLTHFYPIVQCALLLQPHNWSKVVLWPSGHRSLAMYQVALYKQTASLEATGPALNCCLLPAQFHLTAFVEFSTLWPLYPLSLFKQTAFYFLLNSTSGHLTVSVFLEFSTLWQLHPSSPLTFRTESLLTTFQLHSTDF